MIGRIYRVLFVCALIIAGAGAVGCTVVSVHGEHAADVRVVPVIGSARIVPAPGAAVSIDAWGLGLTESCGAVAIGVAISHCAAVDPRGCPVAIVKITGPIDEDFWGRVAQETRVECPPTKEH